MWCLQLNTIHCSLKLYITQHLFTAEYNPLQSEAVYHTACVRLVVCQLALGLDITILKTVKCCPPLKSCCIHLVTLMEGILQFSVFQDLNITVANTQLQTAVDCIRLRKETEHFQFHLRLLKNFS